MFQATEIQNDLNSGSTNQPGVRNMLSFTSVMHIIKQYLIKCVQYNLYISLAVGPIKPQRVSQQLDVNCLGALGTYSTYSVLGEGQVSPELFSLASHQSLPILSSCDRKENQNASINCILPFPLTTPSSSG